jgi:hypothetical protein
MSERIRTTRAYQTDAIIESDLRVSDERNASIQSRNLPDKRLGLRMNVRYALQAGIVL